MFSHKTLVLCAAEKFSVFVLCAVLLNSINWLLPILSDDVDTAVLLEEKGANEHEHDKEGNTGTKKTETELLP